MHYQIIKHLPYTTLEILLELFHKTWDNDNFHKIWKEAAIIQIPKPGKDHENPQTIALLRLLVARTDDQLMIDKYGF